MTYNHSTLILTVAAMSAGLAPVAAHVGDRLYPISYLSEETLAALDQDDGSVEDWTDAVGEPDADPPGFRLGVLWPRDNLPTINTTLPILISASGWDGAGTGKSISP